MREFESVLWPYDWHIGKWKGYKCGRDSRAKAGRMKGGLLTYFLCMCGLPWVRKKKTMIDVKVSLSGGDATRSVLHQNILCARLSGSVAVLSFEVYT